MKNNLPLHQYNATHHTHQAQCSIIYEWHLISQYPFWILDVANNQLGTNIFQLSLPLRPLSYKFVVGDAQTAREILMDDKSTKPMDIYGHMRNLNYRVSLQFGCM